MYDAELCVKYRLAMASLLGNLVAVSACLPIPHAERISPHLVGSYRTATGLPVAGVELAVSRDASCHDLFSRVVTDSAGNFELAEARVHQSVVMLMGDWITEYDLWAHDDSSWTPIYSWSAMGKPPHRVTLTCIQAPRSPSDGSCVPEGQ